jgi:hypothetical protein
MLRLRVPAAVLSWVLSCVPSWVLSCVLGCALSCASFDTVAAPLANTEIEQLCAQAEDAGHCGRLVEEAQLKRLPNLARREGSALLISLFPAGTATFTDSDDPVRGRSYSLWDYLDGVNAVLLYTTAGNKTTFTLLQRTNNRRYELPTEPQVSPDRQRLVTADICGPRCTNEVAVWRVTRDAIRKELAWSPDADWTDAAAKWKDAETLIIEYSVGNAATTTTLERKLGDAAWKRLPISP